MCTEGVNDLFYVEINFTNASMTCVIKKFENSSCIIQEVYGPVEDCSTDLKRSYNETTSYDIEMTSDSVTIDIGNIPNNKMFCFGAIATNPSSTIILEGSFSLPRKTSNSTSITVIATSCLLITLLVVGVTVVSLSAIIARRGQIKHYLQRYL